MDVNNSKPIDVNKSPKPSKYIKVQYSKDNYLNENNLEDALNYQGDSKWDSFSLFDGFLYQFWFWVAEFLSPFYHTNGRKTGNEWVDIKTGEGWKAILFAKPLVWLVYLSVLGTVILLFLSGFAAYGSLNQNTFCDVVFYFTLFISLGVLIYTGASMFFWNPKYKYNKTYFENADIQRNNFRQSLEGTEVNTAKKYKRKMVDKYIKVKPSDNNNNRSSNDNSEEYGAGRKQYDIVNIETSIVSN
jgi:hypothetical protein